MNSCGPSCSHGAHYSIVWYLHTGKLQTDSKNMCERGSSLYQTQRAMKTLPICLPQNLPRSYLRILLYTQSPRLEVVRYCCRCQRLLLPVLAELWRLYCTVDGRLIGTCL